MSVKIISFLFLLCAFVFFANAQTERKTITKGIINGAAKYLPKPEYPQEAKDFCADGKVEIEVLVDETGSVISAKPISGDELLRESSIEAAKQAKFGRTVNGTPIKFTGIVVYNFVSEQKCIEKGIVNDRALKLPKPQVGNIIHPKHLKISKDETVQVRVIIDVWTGEVTKARAVSGHSLLRAACENAARQAKFAPFGHGPRVFVRAILAYKFKSNGKIETKFNEKDFVGKSVN